MWPEVPLLLLGLSIVRGFIIPEELPSLLSLLYSNIPPIKKGTDSRFGVGFRLGPHADFQVLLELGPQSNTAAIGPDAEPFGKRETLQMQNTGVLVDMVNNMRMPLLQPDEAPTDSETSKENEIPTVEEVEMEHKKEIEIEETSGVKVKKSTGGRWLDSWRNAFRQNNYFGKINFKPIPGIDSRRDAPKRHRTREVGLGLTNNMLRIRPTYVDQLSQLYKPQPAIS